MRTQFEEQLNNEITEWANADIHKVGDIVTSIYITGLYDRLIKLIRTAREQKLIIFASDALPDVPLLSSKQGNEGEARATSRSAP